MVHFFTGELWDAPHGEPYMIIVTTNAVANGYGQLIMGAGSASQAKAVYPKLPALCYAKIKKAHPDYRLNGHHEDYGFLPIFDPPCGLGIFQTKRHWSETSRMDTIQKSAEMLNTYAREHPDVNIRLPFPGLGCGRWGEGEKPDPNEVKLVLACLPDNVTVIQWWR